MNEQPATDLTKHGEDLIQVVVAELLKNPEFRASLARAIHSVEANLSEIRANYPSFERHVYAELKAEFERTLPLCRTTISKPCPGKKGDSRSKLSSMS